MGKGHGIAVFEFDLQKQVRSGVDWYIRTCSKKEPVCYKEK